MLREYVHLNRSLAASVEFPLPRQDQHFNSWKDVFPEVEAGGDVEAGQEDLLLSEEDSEDDESFKVR